MGRLRLTIDSDLKDVYLVGLTVNKLCEYLQMDDLEASQVELCAVEAVTNAIRHAYGNRLGHDVSVELSVRDNRLDVEVSDTGLTMLAANVLRLCNGSKVLEFDANDRDSIPEGGMGLQIMHDLMDEVSYRTEGQVNLLRLSRTLAAQPPEPVDEHNKDLMEMGALPHDR